jgi:hypothetical protein
MMASERGAANIRKFNAEREEKNLALVEHELQLCRKRKLQFKSVGLLAAHLSDRTNVHRTTFLRNAKYKVLLAVYMRSQPGAAAVVDDGTDDPYLLKAKLASTQAEVGTLRQEVKRLSAQLSRAEAVQPAPSASRDDVEFANLCVLLSLVLVRAETFAIDSKARTLVDLAARPSERLVGGPDRTAAFVSWLEQNASLPFVKDVKRT